MVCNTIASTIGIPVFDVLSGGLPHLIEQVLAYYKINKDN